MYIHQYSCISPAQSTGAIDLNAIPNSVDGKLIAIEPSPNAVPAGMMRRMSKAVRMGITAGMPLIANDAVDGIIIGTANGGMEDCIRFLNQIVDYEEGLLTPGNFVQSTPNALAGQLSIITKNHGYNVTHVHNGLAFENALIDAMMLLREHPKNKYLVGAVDEISSYNYNIDRLAGWYNISKNNKNLYSDEGPGTVAGEGATMFLLSNNPENAAASIGDIDLFHSADETYVAGRMRDFIQKKNIDLTKTIFLSGENGDSRHTHFYKNCAAVLAEQTAVARFKHMSGEYPTAASFGLWLACEAIKQQMLPGHFYKNNAFPSVINSVLLYNQYQGKQHTFILINQ